MYSWHPSTVHSVRYVLFANVYIIFLIKKWIIVQLVFFSVYIHQIIKLKVDSERENERKHSESDMQTRAHTHAVGENVNKALSCTCHSIIMTHSIMMFVFVFI